MSDRRFDKPRTDTRKPDGDHRNFNRKPDGTLVYSTCTLLSDENRNQVRAFLERHDEFVLDADPSWVPEKLMERFEGGMMQLLAHRDRGMDGFFIAKMRRVK